MTRQGLPVSAGYRASISQARPRTRRWLAGSAEPPPSRWQFKARVTLHHTRGRKLTVVEGSDVVRDQEASQPDRASHRNTGYPERKERSARDAVPARRRGRGPGACAHAPRRRLADRLAGSRSCGALLTPAPPDPTPFVYGSRQRQRFALFQLSGRIRPSSARSQRVSELMCAVRGLDRLQERTERCSTCTTTGRH